MASFPVLYGESSHGKQKLWSVEVEDRGDVGIVVQRHGYVDGKIVANERAVTVGKNLGKKNATTAVEQAVSEAQALWNKKCDAAYAPAKAAGGAAGGAVAAGGAGSAGGGAGADAIEDTSGAVASAVLPMLAKDFNKNSKHIVFPCFAQRKLDGVRCVAIPGRGLFSRNGKAFPHMEHVRAEVDCVGRVADNLILDGELYSDDLTFQEIVGLVKKETLRPEDAARLQKIHLCVYDCILDGTTGYDARKTVLEDLFGSQTFQHLRLLPTVLCVGMEDVKRLHADYVAEGYEGLILRNKSGPYTLKHRSNDLQKYKEFFDAEYPIVGFREGDGVEKGCVIWVCRTFAGQEFAVRPRGTHEERQIAFAGGVSTIGKRLTVRYQELTDDGLPRFPVGLAIRDYE